LLYGPFRLDTVPSFANMPIGSIYCRFRQASPELKALGWLLVSISCLEGDFEPYFLLEEDKMRSPARQISLTQTILQDMHFHGHFELEPLSIKVLDETSEVSLSLALHTAPYPSGSTVLPISGFPRRIMAEPSGIGGGAASGPGNAPLGMHRAPSKSSLNYSFRSTTPTPAPTPPPPYIPVRTSSRGGNNHYPILIRHGVGAGAERTGAFTNFSGKIPPSYINPGGLVGHQEPQSIRN
jgi:hypothetical protein